MPGADRNCQTCNSTVNGERTARSRRERRTASRRRSARDLARTAPPVEPFNQRTHSRQTANQSVWTCFAW